MKYFTYQMVWAIGLLFLGTSAKAEVTYWLTNVAAPIKAPLGQHPYLEDPSSQEGEVAAITIAGSHVLFNGEWCDYQIEKIKKFRVDRTLSDLIQDIGGSRSFDVFLFKKLKTRLAEWQDEIIVKQSDRGTDEYACKLLQGSSIFRNQNSLILWDTIYFYRFELGRPFRY